MTGTQVYFSGVENTTYYNKVKHAGVRTCLMSYFYLLKRGTNLLSQRKQEDPDMKFIIDSGAHTFQGNLQTYSVQQYDDYVAQYADWVEENRAHITACVELDAEDVLGYDKILEWEEKYFIPLEQSGIPTIFVWHPSRGIKEFAEMCKRHRYVGIAQDISCGPSVDMNQFRAIARKYMTQLHGFGITKTNWLLKNWFTTTDSTTWKAGEMYGVAYVWDGAQLLPLTIKRRDERPKYNAYYLKHGLDPAKILSGVSSELTKLNVVAWNDMVLAIQERYGSQVMPWDLRPPFPDLVETMSLEEKEDWAWRLRIVDERADLVEFDEELMENQISIMSILLNSMYEDIRLNADAVNELLKPRLDITMPLGQNSSDTLIDVYRDRLAAYVMVRASRTLNISEREATDYAPNFQPIERETPLDALEEPRYDFPILP